MTLLKRKVVILLNDESIPQEEKVTILRQLEADSLAKERSATEGMTPVGGDDGEDLKTIEMALRRLGQEPLDSGAASL